MLFPEAVPLDGVESAIRTFRSELRGAFRLRPSRKSIEIKVSKRTLGDAYGEQFLSEASAWADYFAKKDAKEK